MRHRFAGQEDGAAVQLVVGLLLDPRQLGLEKDLTELCRGQARADDRAVEGVCQLPDASPFQFELSCSTVSRLQQAHGRRRHRFRCSQRQVNAGQLDRHPYVISV
jgi:hypothetical protein